MSANKTRDEIDAIAISLTVQLQYKLQNIHASERTARNRQSSPDDARDLAKRFGQASAARTTWNDRRNHPMLDTFTHLDQEIDRYENPKLHERALDMIPFDKLASEAEQLAGTRKDLDFQDCLAQVLVEWAKRDFLKWVDPVKCAQCNGDTDAIGGGTPSSIEREEGGAGRVELYRCKKDGSTTRFPRYTKLQKLLDTRTGRCGEFAALFMLLLRSLGFRARYIWNSEDHVWNEYYSDHLKRWVHLDSCEGARDKHLLYDIGWGKRMKYCIAFGLDGASDVTRSYVSDWKAALSRRQADLEQPIALHLARISERRRAGRSDEDLAKLSEEDRLEEAWLADHESRKLAAEQNALEGRTSGTKEWRAVRSELGNKIQKPGLKALQLVHGSKDSQPTCNGSAHLSNSTLHLTRGGTDQTGSAFLALPSEVAAVIVEFSFRINQPGADGMALVFHSASSGASTLGEGGCELGYGGIPHSIAIEIDTYRSEDRCADPPTPHISIHSRGELPNSAHHSASLWCTKPGSLPNLDDNREYSLKVEMSTGIRIWFTEAGGEWVELTEKPVPAPKVGKKYVGWTASSGGISQSHTVTKYEIWQAAQEDATKDSTE